VRSFSTRRFCLTRADHFFFLSRGRRIFSRRLSIRSFFYQARRGALLSSTPFVFDEIDGRPPGRPRKVLFSADVAKPFSPQPCSGVLDPSPLPRFDPLGRPTLISPTCRPVAGPSHSIARASLLFRRTRALRLPLVTPLTGLEFLFLLSSFF